jgi:manganese efflux pump family protein
VLAVLLVALSLGLSNFAASIGIGITGTDARTRLRIAAAFGAFEAGMPVVGLLLGRSLAAPLGHATRPAGAGVLIAVGIYAVVQSLRGTSDDHLRSGRLLVTAAALSIDNLAVGFALGTYHVSLLIAALIIGTVSVGLSLLGLELGNQLGARTGKNGEILGGVVLIGVGIALAAGAL